MAIRTPLGISDFQQLRQSGGYYVDKSHLLVELLDDLTQVLLLTRPRRFGKTLNLSMLRYFLEKSNEDRSPLFADLAVWRSEATRHHFSRYPVVSLSFKDVRAASFASALRAIGLLLADAYSQHRYLLDAGLPPDKAASFRSMLDGTASEEQCWSACGV